MPTQNVVFSKKHQKKENAPHCRCLLHTQALESFPVTRNVYVNYFGLEIFPLKGQCHEIFDFRFSTRISFLQAPDYTIRAVSNFFEYSRRYSQLNPFLSIKKSGLDILLTGYNNLTLQTY
jgi:hypothetical protein